MSYKLYAARTRGDRPWRKGFRDKELRKADETCNGGASTVSWHLRWCRGMRQLFRLRRVRHTLEKIQDESRALKLLSSRFLRGGPPDDLGPREGSSGRHRMGGLVLRAADAAHASPGAYRRFFGTLGTMSRRLLEVSLFRGRFGLISNLLMKIASYFEKPICLICGGHYGTMGCLAYELKTARRALEYARDLGQDALQNQVNADLVYRVTCAIDSVWLRDQNTIASFAGMVSRSLASAVLLVPGLAQLIAVLGLTTKVCYVLTGRDLPFRFTTSDWARIYRTSMRGDLMEGMWHLVSMIGSVRALPGGERAVEEVFGSEVELKNLTNLAIKRWWNILTPFESKWLGPAIDARLTPALIGRTWRDVLRESPYETRKRHTVRGRRTAADDSTEDRFTVWRGPDVT